MNFIEYHAPSHSIVISQGKMKGKTPDVVHKANEYKRHKGKWNENVGGARDIWGASVRCQKLFKN